MGFDASKPNIPTLDYDFRPYVNSSGISPEPTEEMVYEFQFAVRDAATILGREPFDPNDQAAVVKFMRDLTKEDMKQINTTIFKALAKLVDNRPSAEDMMALAEKAYRLGQAYIGSLMGDIMDPKAVNAATNT